MKPYFSVAARAAVSLMLIASARGHLGAQAPQGPVREYTLLATILGYRGVGGEIDGIRNPTLWATAGERVRITIVNGELMVHDVALEQHAVKSQEILEKGATTSVAFLAKQSDTYYCSIPGHRAAGMEGRIDVADAPRVRSEGVRPETNGRALNLDFERGTLDDWTTTGDAFEIIKGDTAKGTDQRSGHAGEYWISSAPRGGERKGILSSTRFRVTHPFASFLVSGGAFASTRVEIVLAESGEVIYGISGAERPMLRPAVVDLRAHAGKDITIRVVDDEAGTPTAAYIKPSPWAYISFDHFRFHESRPFFPGEVTPAEMSVLPPMDPVTHAGLSPGEAARAMTLPPGFSATLAASEPDVVRPIGFAHDDRGRLWVAEAHTYPARAPENEGTDRILILEDTNGDGTLDSRKVFMEGLNLVSGIEIGFGGVWVGAAPYLLFIPVEDGTDRPSGPPKVLLDGWGYQDTHETLNTFTWGPDGWLYGTHGVFTHSNVGKPGAPDTERQRLNAGVWRYHPTRHVFEIFAEGTSNPWGIDFNDYGHAFVTACVIEHLYHVVQGARYKRQAGRHFNPHIYDDIKTVADHVHWVGRKGPHAGNQRSGAAGGGHAHVGAMFYLGGDNWPREYRDAIFMNNIHGHRWNTDRLARKGSGYAAAHGPDFLMANDSWSQMLNFRYGPDGSVHVIDWYDKNQCHSSNPEIHQKSLGRIFRISHQNDRWTQVDLRKLPSEELVNLQLNRNDWYVRHSRRILQERGPDPAVRDRLRTILDTNPDVARKLRALWALHVTAGLGERDLLRLLDHDSEYLRSWAVYLLAEGKNPPGRALDRFADLARRDSSALVRLYLASALQRVPVEKRWPILEALVARQEDAADHNLPLMVWYAAEPMAEANMERALALALGSTLPRIFTFTVQRIAAIGTPAAIRLLAGQLTRPVTAEQQRDLVNGLNEIMKKPGP
jgi:putative membrane-bound dehydrogenase-like protein